MYVLLASEATSDGLGLDLELEGGIGPNTNRGYQVKGEVGVGLSVIPVGCEIQLKFLWRLCMVQVRMGRGGMSALYVPAHTGAGAEEETGKRAGSGLPVSTLRAAAERTAAAACRITMCEEVSV
jgi:hypothetical protein